MVTARELAGRLSLRRNGREYRGACPCCGKPALTVEEKGGRALWRCFYGCDQAALTAALLGGVESRPPPPAFSGAANDRRAVAVRLWDIALPPQGTPVEIYLAGRHVPPPERAPIRFLPMAKHPCGRRLPVMVALLVDVEGCPTAIHRTFLTPDGGKAKVDPQRMTLGPVRGAAVRLYQASERLVVAEGIETALAAAILLRMPAWAAVSAGNMADALMLPHAVREVIVACDHDAPGLAAAQRAAARWKAEGRIVRIAKPDRPGADFNDLLRERVFRGQ